MTQPLPHHQSRKLYRYLEYRWHHSKRLEDNINNWEELSIPIYGEFEYVYPEQYLENYLEDIRDGLNDEVAYA
ncbi:MAG: hypothetical protein KTR14_01825 [Vampirovibrio sp.]|nr:hypothetical protein [Vampirovibrio sp.]